MHLQRTFAREHSPAKDALVGISRRHRLVAHEGADLLRFITR